MEPVILADGSGGAAVLLIAIGLTPFWLAPLVGISIYLWIYRFYRNTDKRHDVERRTRVEVYHVDGFDHYRSHVRGARSSQIAGRNDDHPVKRVRRFEL